ncbi:MAG: Mg chelatase, subunit ChlI, magnesium chelatase family protein [Candidatus Peregrinibacteria bacterium GW2011_GWF2_43_17]|nr:MAG: Mg chelatase, subunit ChlI, magnesium chelatase family protein [Candidatus Peregrinibacteria bacterium GW2011_GWF2_43_17]HAU39384.1 magnesium chelatase [Candidatus Peregrinibacteria bacterium]
MSTVVFSAMTEGVASKIVGVETELARGMPYFIMVGLADTEVTEAKERVRTAILSSGFEFPRFRKVINLAPSNLRKHGTQFDLPIAVGLLAATAKIKPDLLDSSVFIGELALGGAIRGVRGTLSMVEEAKNAGFKRVFVSADRAKEAGLVPGIEIFIPKNLKELVSHLNGGKEVTKYSVEKFEIKRPEGTVGIKGHSIVKRALSIAISGRHHIVLVGAAGMGKTILAKSVTGLMPPLSQEDISEIVKVYSSFTDDDLSSGIERPFREISNTVSVGTLIGGGSKLRAGEMTLAHKGVLMTDDIHTFSRAHVEALLKPMEEKVVLVSTGKKKVLLPADFSLIATMNPCPCGERLAYNDFKCGCKSSEVKRFLSKFPQAFWDRVDMVLEVPRLEEEDLTPDDANVRGVDLKKIYERQHGRLSKFGLKFNGEMDVAIVGNACELKKGASELLNRALAANMVSGRGYFNTIKVARSIADFEDHKDIEPSDIAEALSYRKSSATI